ncbi:MAG: M48 family metalloprotease [Gammaproteobacteria bacterium]
MDLVYRHEKPLFLLSMVIGTLVWLAAVIGTFGIALIYALLFLLIYLFAQSGFISHLRGNAVELGEQQFPDLYAQYREACQKLGIVDIPAAYLMMSDGVLNALAAKFLRRHYVVLYSSVVEALRSRPAALRFYFGHELAHIKRGHLNLSWLRWPASILPLLGAGYRRAQEYTCDLHGLAASLSREDVFAALGVLAAGGEKLPQLNTAAFMAQQRQAGGFWMSYHELTGDYPWLSKRLANVARAGAPAGSDLDAPRRNSFAWVLAALTPRLGFGGGSLIVLVAMIGILAAIAIPAYRDYTMRAQVMQVMPVVLQVQSQAGGYIAEHGAYPDVPEDMGLPSTLDSGPVSAIQVLEDGIELTLRSEHAALDGMTLLLAAYRNDDGSIGWDCTGGTVAEKHRPVQCRNAP